MLTSTLHKIYVNISHPTPDASTAITLTSFCIPKDYKHYTLFCHKYKIVSCGKLVQSHMYGNIYLT